MAKLTLSLSGKSHPLPDNLKVFEPTHSSRYWIVSQLINATGGKPRILDVGGKKGLLREFGDYNSTVIDIEPSDEPNFVQGNALDMPFKDNEFNISITCDVLEHIAEPDRDQFITEMLRVSKDFVIIAAPFDNPGVSNAEVEANNYFVGLTGTPHQWLKEHIDNGLPSEANVEKLLNSKKIPFAKFHHFDLEVWSIMVKAHMMDAAFGDSEVIQTLAKQLYQDYFTQYGSYDFSEAGYRTFYVISKQGEIEIQLPSMQERQTKKLHFVETISKQALSATEDLARGWRTQVQQLQPLEAANKEIADLRQELHDIKNSKRYQLASKFHDMKAAITFNRSKK